MTGPEKDPVTVSRPPDPSGTAPSPSPLRAWLYLVWLSWQRQARARQMVWVALGLMALSVAFVAVNTAVGRWRSPRGVTPENRAVLVELGSVLGLLSQSPAGGEAPNAVLGSVWGAMAEQAGFAVFSRVIIFSIFMSFLLPLWSLSFATEALGGEREARSLVWLLTRPLPRPAVYLAKFVALLPWSLGLNLVGFVLMCVAAGKPGLLALRLFWPSVVWGTLAFSALFLLIGAYFRRPAIVAIVYSFFLETILGNMPGYLKRASLSFYTRCMMFEVAEQYGVPPEKPSVYLPVDGQTAWLVLVGATVILLVVGMVVFSRSEYVSVD
jgi:ABC-2 type transport system permease protein